MSGYAHVIVHFVFAYVFRYRKIIQYNRNLLLLLREVDAKNYDQHTQTIQN